MLCLRLLFSQLLEDESDGCTQAAGVVDKHLDIAFAAWPMFEQALTTHHYLVPLLFEFSEGHDLLLLSFMGVFLKKRR